MRFKIYSFIFVFIACFLLFSYNPIQGEMQEKPKTETVFLGDPLTQEQKTSVISQIEILGKFFENREFEKIGQFYKSTGRVTAYDLKPIQGKEKIAAYFRELHGKGVRSVKFTPECVYAQKLEEGTRVSDLKEKGVIQKDDKPDEVSLDDMVTHALHAIISISFKLEEKKYNQGPGSSWDGFHIHGCPIF